MRLEDDFEVIRELGRGGFGRVLLVRDRKTKKLWAAKLLNSNDLESLHRFHLEVKQLHYYRARGLRFVMPLVKHFLAAEPPFFVMPYAEGGSLTAHAGRLSDRQCVTVMRQLMEALTAIHAEGAFHRDVKPDNLLLLAGTTAIADFGLGNSPNCTVHFTMSTGGTPGYAAPELFHSESWFTTAADVFSAGATWFHLLTGQHPKGRALPLDPRSVKSATPEWMALWVRAMTDGDPARRPAASQVVQALTTALRGRDEPLPATEPTDVVADFIKLGALIGLGVVAVKLLSKSA